MRQPPVWPNGDAATVSRIFLPSKYQPGQLVCGEPRLPAAPPRRVSPPEDRRGPGVPPGVPGQPAESGAPATRITGGGIAKQHPAAVERNRQQQHVRDQKRRLRDLANNNSAFDLKHSAAEVWLLGSGLQNLANNNSAPAQVWVLEALPPRKPPPSESCKQQPPGVPAASAG